jgi:hypothetical protein
MVVFLRCDIGNFLDGKPFRAYPLPGARAVHVEVPEPYRRDFVEASAVLSESPKASAALSRRCLQALLVGVGSATAKRQLNEQIDEVISSGGLPSFISEQLHAVREIGNFAAHPTKANTTGLIVDVEVGEAEWNLDVLHALFDFYFIGPKRAAARKAALNEKLKDAGRKAI